MDASNLVTTNIKVSRFFYFLLFTSSFQRRPPFPLVQKETRNKLARKTNTSCIHKKKQKSNQKLIKKSNPGLRLKKKQAKTNHKIK